MFGIVKNLVRSDAEEGVRTRGWGYGQGTAVPGFDGFVGSLAAVCAKIRTFGFRSIQGFQVSGGILGGFLAYEDAKPQILLAL